MIERVQCLNTVLLTLGPMAKQLAAFFPRWIVSVDGVFEVSDSFGLGCRLCANRCGCSTVSVTTEFKY